jgi:hypothetical protein
LFISSGTDTFNKSEGYLKIPYPSDNMIIEITMAYPISLENDQVSIISFESRAFGVQGGNYLGDVYGYSTYNELLKHYSLPNVLASIGEPGKIYVVGYLRGDTLVTPGFGDHFDIHLWYPDQGIFLVYKMAVERSGSNYRFCPSNALISGNLIENDLVSNYKDVLISLDSRLYELFFQPSQFIKSTEDAFGMSEEEFYKLFHSPMSRCLETPISIWWPKGIPGQ